MKYENDFYQESLNLGIKKKPDSNAICSPHNPEARYVRKGSQRITGDKGVVTETGEEIRAKLTIGADGRISTIAKKAGLLKKWDPNV